MTKRFVTTDDGTTLLLVERKLIGLVPCTGEAHSNPHIDNCMLCAPRWGQMLSYAPLFPDACAGRVGVPVNDGDEAAFKAAEELGEVRMVRATEKRNRGCTSSFFVWVSTEAREHPSGETARARSSAGRSVSEKGEPR